MTRLGRRSCYGFDITYAAIDARIAALPDVEDMEDRRKTSVFLQKKRNSYKGYHTLSDVGKYQTLALMRVGLGHVSKK